MKLRTLGQLMLAVMIIAPASIASMDNKKNLTRIGDIHLNRSMVLFRHLTLVDAIESNFTDPEGYDLKYLCRTARPKLHFALRECMLWESYR